MNFNFCYKYTPDLKCGFSSVELFTKTTSEYRTHGKGKSNTNWWFSQVCGVVYNGKYMLSLRESCTDVNLKHKKIKQKGWGK